MLLVNQSATLLRAGGAKLGTLNGFAQMSSSVMRALDPVLWWFFLPVESVPSREHKRDTSSSFDSQHEREHENSPSLSLSRSQKIEAVGGSNDVVFSTLSIERQSPFEREEQSASNKRLSSPKRRQHLRLYHVSASRSRGRAGPKSVLPLLTALDLPLTDNSITGTGCAPFLPGLDVLELSSDSGSESDGESEAGADATAPRRSYSLPTGPHGSVAFVLGRAESDMISSQQ
ncbi:hypothetical protein K437DRAFT_271334 [Tilletiaria anomala UBC 951]|uniref:Uncharacterized protein n=1 Tax=Tilletiaria anomala (strain ATCC 24038 / CBS 436.72 / UBC 951) TaxID=1037660 RepID=A0A066V5B2_TILAU|nr:uncharacterized protein K437DRAFT_271334 [Tilletiaria anomala UBC 951]KDN35428.1 hypothetical protein K437DRAFT_271334 [Tilletiaria anomala UBC 951]